MPAITRHPDSILAVDADYVRPQLAAVHLVIEKGRVAVVDTGSANSVPRILEALATEGLGPECVDLVMLTHIHLDHAGGAGALMRACPSARLVVHPRGARHMADPARLWAGTVAVYGEESARALYGELLPVPAERIIEARDGLVLSLAGREFTFIDSPGHARHHVCIWDATARAFFTGDTFGLSYREFDVEGRPSVIPTTTPVQFEPEAMHGSIDRMLSFKPEAMYLTHYSRVGEVERLAADLHRLIDAHVAVARGAKGEGAERHARIREGLAALYRAEARRQAWPLQDAALLEFIEIDLELSAQGLGIWLDTQRAGARVPA